MGVSSYRTPAYAPVDGQLPEDLPQILCSPCARVLDRHGCRLRKRSTPRKERFIEYRAARKRLISPDYLFLLPPCEISVRHSFAHALFAVFLRATYPPTATSPVLKKMRLAGSGIT